MTKKLELLPPGTKVSVLAPDPFEAEISSINIISEECIVLYEVFWWEAKEKKELTLRDYEVSCSQKANKMHIGFGVK